MATLIQDFNLFEHNHLPLYGQLLHLYTNPFNEMVSPASYLVSGSEGIDASHSGGHPPQSTREESSMFGAAVGEFVPSQVPMTLHASRQYYHVVREKRKGG